MWAHLQDEPPPLRGHPALDPVLRKALAKDKDERHATCVELIDAARAALGLAAPASVRHVRVPQGLLRRRRVILAAGLLLLGAVAAAAITALTGDSAEAESVPTGNGVAAIDRTGKKIASFVEAASAPSNIALGEGAVWFLNTTTHRVAHRPGDEGVTRTSRRTRADRHRGRRGSALDRQRAAAGTRTHGQRVARRPGTGRVTHTAKLPDRTGVGALGSFSWGHPDIAVGDGAVWAINPDRTVSRLDPETGARVATIDVDAEGIAAGAEGVWVTARAGMSRASTRARTGSPTRIRLSGGNSSAIAVGGGKLWLTDEREGCRVADRARAGSDRADDRRRRRRRLRRLRCRRRLGRQLRLWHRLADRPGARTASPACPVGAVQALGGRRRRGLGQHRRPAPSGYHAGIGVQPDLASGGRKPDVLIASDLPLQGPRSAPPRATASTRSGSCSSSTATGRALQRRLPVVRRVDGADRRLRAAPLRRERQRVRAREALAGRADRPVQLVLRRDRPPDAQPRGGRPGADDQPDEHRRRADAHRRAAGRRGRKPRRARRLLPDRRAQLRAPAGGRRSGGNGASACSPSSSGSRASTSARARSARPVEAWRPSRSSAARRRSASGSPAVDVQHGNAGRFAALADAVARSGADGVVLGADPYTGGTGS